MKHVRRARVDAIRNATAALTPGTTLIELLIAMTIGSALMIGAISVYAQARAAYRTNEDLVRLHETLHFAHGILRRDTRLANFWGRARQAGDIMRESAITIRCRGRNVTDWALDLDRGVEARDEGYDLPCPGFEPAANSDVLIVRHAQPGSIKPGSTKPGSIDPGSTEPGAAEPEASSSTRRAVQLQSNGSGGRLFSAGRRPAAFDPGGVINDIAVNAYYVSTRSQYDPDAPALRRRSLVGATMQDQEVIAGIEKLKIRLGIDSDGDDAVDTYINPGDADSMRPENRILSVRLSLQARSNRTVDGRSVGDDRDDTNALRASTTQTIFLRNRRPALPMSPPPPDEPNAT